MILRTALEDLRWRAVSQTVGQHDPTRVVTVYHDPYMREFRGRLVWAGVAQPGHDYATTCRHEAERLARVIADQHDNS
jgi:hypothetical protein